jgi:hypothetical protein
MREMTEYEKKMWSNWYSDGPEFITYGDELGEAFDAALACTTMADYGLSDEFVEAAKIQVLDMYYYQVHLYTGDYGGYETAEELGLPPLEDFYAKIKEIIFRDNLQVNMIDHLSVYSDSDTCKEAFDWAMEWRREHIDELRKRYRVKQLRQELDSLDEEDNE